MAAPYSYQTPGNTGWFSTGFWKDAWNDMWNPQGRAYNGNSHLIDSRRQQGSAPVISTAAPKVGPRASAPSGPAPQTPKQPAPVYDSRNPGLVNKAIATVNRMTGVAGSANNYRNMSDEDLIRTGRKIALMYARNPRQLGDSHLMAMAEIGNRGIENPKFANSWSKAVGSIPGSIGDNEFQSFLQAGGHLGEARDPMGNAEKLYMKTLLGYDVDRIQQWHDKTTLGAFKQGMQDNYWNWAWKPMQQNGISGFGDSLSRIGMGIDACGKANNMPWLNKYTVGGGLALGTLGLGALALSGGSNDQSQQPQYPGYPNPQRNMYMNFYGGPNAFSYGTNYSRRTF